MKKLLQNQRGTSMAIAIGLIVLIILASSATNLLIIRNLRAVSKIEASNRAFFAAEGGIEDALYELSPRLAGYETVPFSDPTSFADPNVRQSSFNEGGTVTWKTNWEIEGLSETNTLNGNLSTGEKLVISLYEDKSGKDLAESPHIFGEKEINDQELTPEVHTIAVDNLNIDFTIPNGNALLGGSTLQIDNDGDAWITAKDSGINEDSIGDPVTITRCAVTGISSQDDDCDGQENEDSEEDPVIIWRIFDDKGNTLTAKKGCLSDGGSEICEKEFQNGLNYTITLNSSTEGVDQNNETKAIGNTTTAGTFLGDIFLPDSKIQMEFTVIAPLEHVQGVNERTPFTLQYSADITSGEAVPLPYFTINSDGYYIDFKQSISTRVIPKTIVPLLDFTIIQQQ